MSPEERKLKPEEIKAKFRIYFEEWKEFTERPEVMLSSRPADYIKTEAYDNIIKLGKPAIPLIIEKMEEGEFLLNEALSRITAMKLSKASRIVEDELRFYSEQEKSKQWINWWKKQKGAKRYLGNKNKTEVHDLWNETSRCQISKIRDAGHDVTFDPDTLEEAHRQGYDNCAYCIGGSLR